MSAFESPIPLSDIESVLAWVDLFKLSRLTKKINRDFSDGVLLAEILNVYYPKLVEMHNYPPRNSHALKLNNWMTLNRKVLRKLKLNLCCSTMEQLANSAPGVIERVLLMVREKIRRDEELKAKDGNDQEMSSGGSYYEACGDDEHVLVVPVKSRINGVLEIIQQKVVSHDMFLMLKQELQDYKECNEVLKTKVEHLDCLMKLKDERIEELQKQLERKQTRRMQVDALQNSLGVPFESDPPTPKLTDSLVTLSKTTSIKLDEAISKISEPDDIKSKDELKFTKSEDNVSSNICSSNSSNKPSLVQINESSSDDQHLIDEPRISKSEEHVTNTNSSISARASLNKRSESKSKIPKLEEFYLRDLRDTQKKSKLELVEDFKRSEEKLSRVPSVGKPVLLKNVDDSKHSFNDIRTTESTESPCYEVDRIESNIFKEIEIIQQKSEEYFDFNDSLEDDVITIEDSIKNEVKEITNPLEFPSDNYI